MHYMTVLTGFDTRSSDPGATAALLLNQSKRSSALYLTACCKSMPSRIAAARDLLPQLC